MCYENIFLFQPTHSRQSMKDKLFDQLDEQQKYNELSYENLKYVQKCRVDTIKIEVEEDNINNCIIFDDMGAYLRENKTKLLLKELGMNRRHYHTSIFFYVKHIKVLNLIYVNYFLIYFYSKYQKREMEGIMDEIIEYHTDNIDKL